MAHSFLSFAILCIFLLVPLSESGGLTGEKVEQVKCTDPGKAEPPAPTPSLKSWCIPKPSATYQQLVDNMSYACNLVNCSAVQSGGPCYYPNSLINHASFAMNLYYQKAGRNDWNCDFKNSGVIGVSDPSYGYGFQFCSVFLAFICESES
ncbi:major pollen allergen Ole e 10-like [Ipomoea triloba]|uniref:major pollen allergen Ole e 10-like n=1 Tax=Ipomoea triloba TaxID=35885 RepID=UPI00125CF07C|nr:major pollen allergen Ole e 10-like [Ipomoea triloba]